MENFKHLLNIFAVIWLLMDDFRKFTIRKNRHFEKHNRYSYKLLPGNRNRDVIQSVIKITVFTCL